MTLPSWILRGIRAVFATRPEATPDLRVRVQNTTRQTILASNLEVAESAAKRNKGLLGRKGLAAGEGLWIVPCESVHTFGMQFAIDLVYLDRKHRVRKVRSAVPPWRISICLSAHSILELPSGTILASHTGKGDLLELSEIDRSEKPMSVNESRRTVQGTP
jgi:uncharacterized membrane protein (UPF0127 family)